MIKEHPLYKGLTLASHLNQSEDIVMNKISADPYSEDHMQTEYPALRKIEKRLKRFLQYETVKLSVGTSLGSVPTGLQLIGCTGQRGSTAIENHLTLFEVNLSPCEKLSKNKLMVTGLYPDSSHRTTQLEIRGFQEKLSGHELLMITALPESITSFIGEPYHQTVSVKDLEKIEEMLQNKIESEHLKLPHLNHLIKQSLNISDYLIENDQDCSVRFTLPDEYFGVVVHPSTWNILIVS